MITCETVLADFTSEEGLTVSLVLPAFTVPETEFRRRVEMLTEEYVAFSVRSGNANHLSLADFVLYAARKAAEDPRTMKESKLAPGTPDPRD